MDLQISRYFMEREHYLDKIEGIFRVHPACAILGARQVGKTTLAQAYAKKYFPEDTHFFDLEDPLDFALLEHPMQVLSSVTKTLTVIDEIQRRPDLFPILRVLIDKYKKSRRFLILGSASRDLLRQSSESLAGRIGYMELTPFSLTEVKDSKKLWLRGGFPLSYLANSDEDSYSWRQSYISSFLERDIPNLGFTIPAQQMRRFWLMISHYHGQLFNANEISKSLGISRYDEHTTAYGLDSIATGDFFKSLPH
jgi:uncharacterized protein